MKNDFIIRGKEATLFVEAPPNVGYGSVEVKLDAADMDVVKSWPGTWFSFIHKSNGQLYIRATAHRVGGKVVNVPGFEQKQPLYIGLYRSRNADRTQSLRTAIA